MRFTIRDLLWLMVVVGLAVGWWVDHRSLFIARTNLQRREETLNAEAARNEQHLFQLMQRSHDEINAANAERSALTTMKEMHNKLKAKAAD